MNSRLETNIWKLTAQKSLVTAYFQLPIIVLFWQEAGLNMSTPSSANRMTTCSEICARFA